MKKFLLAVGAGLITVLAFFYFCGDRPSHTISFSQLKKLRVGMSYNEVTNTIGIPDLIRPFGAPYHDLNCPSDNNDFAFIPGQKIDIAGAINTTYSDSAPCCEGMKESWLISRSPSFRYENPDHLFHDLGIIVGFDSNGKLNGYVFFDNGVLSKTDNGMVYSSNGKLYRDTGLTPIYTDEEIEMLIRKL